MALEPGPMVPLHGAKANEDPTGHGPAHEHAAVAEKPPILPDELISKNGRRGDNDALELNPTDPVNNGAAGVNGVICCVPAEEVMNEPKRAEGKGERPNAEEIDDNPKAFDVLPVTSAEIPGKEKTEAEESREFGEPFGASAIQEGDASAALPAFDDRLLFCQPRWGFAARR